METLGIRLAASFREQAEIWRAQRSVFLETGAAGAVHKMRVSVRRSRALLRAFQGVLPASSVALSHDLRDLAQELGGARDLAVGLAHLIGRDDLRQVLGRDWHRAVCLATEALRTEERLTQEIVADYDGSAEWRELDALAAGLSRGEHRALGWPAVFSGPVLVERHHRSWERALRGLRKRSPETDYHAARIKGKRLRYVCEFFAPLVDEVRFVNHLSGVQDRFGLFQDLMVLAEHLENWGLVPASESVWKLGMAQTPALRSLGQETQKKGWKRLQKRLSRVALQSVLD